MERTRTALSKAVYAILVTAAAVLAACGGDSIGVEQPSAGTPFSQEAATIDLTVNGAGGSSHLLSVEIADTPAERAEGLTGRTSLGKDSGMLFVIDRRGPGFWMKDVSIPLSVAFIDGCGVIVAIARMEPFSERFHNTEHEYRFGLEVNRGWFEAHSVSVGDTVVLPEGLDSNGC